MQKYDVVIVGAGPAGSTAAYFLAQAGVKVCLIDRQTFPRDKVCGDGVAANGLARLGRMHLDGWVEQHAFNAPGELLFSAPNEEAVRILPDNRDTCYGRVIPRLSLDEALARQTVTAGANLLEGVKLAPLDRPAADTIRLAGSFRENGAGVRLESRLLITADGAHASFTRSLGLVKAEPDLVAVRAYFENVGGGDSLLEIHFDSGLMPGYAWIFPLAGGRANVGLGTYVSRSRQHDVDLKQALRRFIQENPYARERLAQARMISPLKGFPLRAQMRSVTPFADNVLVAGEAAGLVNPLNGEGIGTALISGELAARRALAALEQGDFSAAFLSAYAQSLRQHIGRNHQVAALLRRLLSVPGVLNRTVRRARRDHGFAQTLFGVILEAEPPAAVFRPGFLLRLLAG